MTIGRCLPPQYKQAAFRIVFSSEGQVGLAESTGFHVQTVTLNFTWYAYQLRDLEQICLGFLICKTETVAPASDGCFWEQMR